MPSSDLPRRQFVLQTAAAMGVFLAEHRAFSAQNVASSRFPIITFTKPFQNIGFQETADLIAEVGYDGIECPLRKEGQVLPERVEEDLPKLRDALKSRGVDLTLITTDVAKVTPLNEKVLRTAAKLGIKRYRLAFSSYDLSKPIPPQLANIRAQLKDLVALNKELGIQGGIQNHSGRDHVGAPVWDIYELVAGFDGKHLGTCFDIGHATLEGGYSWTIDAKLMEPFLTCVYVKDFLWKKNDKGWSAEWLPLGEGMVNPKFFEWLKASSYSGPISQHCEYLKGGSPADRAQMKKDLAVLKGWLS